MVWLRQSTVLGIRPKLLMMIWIKDLQAGAQMHTIDLLSVVAESRSKSYEEIKEIAGGRVWIATSAREIGLVDEIGGIDDAIAHAANITKLEDYQVKYYGEELSNAELILKELLENSDVSFGEHKVMSALNDLATLYETLAGIQEPKVLLTCTDCVVDLD